LQDISAGSECGRGAVAGCAGEDSVERSGELEANDMLTRSLPASRLYGSFHDPQRERQGTPRQKDCAHSEAPPSLKSMCTQLSLCRCQEHTSPRNRQLTSPPLLPSNTYERGRSAVQIKRV